MAEINEYAQDDVVIMLIGNKSDMTGHRAVRKEDGESVARVRFPLFAQLAALVECVSHAPAVSVRFLVRLAMVAHINKSKSRNLLLDEWLLMNKTVCRF